ncbi:MAG: hypothetical protein NVSMB51_09830 [Solirubrobacteraceae bacterium]
MILMTDFASLATAIGTLVLAVATFASVRSGQRSARLAERALLLGLRPVLAPARADRPGEEVLFGDGHLIQMDQEGAAVEQHDETIYMVIPLRNVGTGLAVLHAWHLYSGLQRAGDGHADPDDFRQLQRDLYIAAGDSGFWQGAVRDGDDPNRPPAEAAARAAEPLTVDLLYGDHEGGQRTISRFVLTPRDGGGWVSGVTRHWNLEAADPRRL